MEKREKLIAAADQRTEGVFGTSELYASLEYSKEDGRLLSADGDLFTALNLEYPENIKNFPESFSDVGLSETTYNKLISFFNELSCDKNKLTYADNLCIKKAEPEKFVSICGYTGSRSISLIFTVLPEREERIQSLIDKTQIESLTGALNRAAIENAVNNLVNDGGNHAFIMLDLDGFKRLNDTYGHVYGDNMLINVVSTLKHGMRKSDIIGRIGGDEFFICLANINDPSVIRRIAKHICVLTHHSLSEGVSISASLGIVTSPADGQTFGELYEKADAAMYNAKRRGGNCFSFFSEIRSSDNEAVKENPKIVEGAFLKSNLDSIIITYDITSGAYTYPVSLSRKISASFTNRPFWKALGEDGIAEEAVCVALEEKFDDVCRNESNASFFTDCKLKVYDDSKKWFRVGAVKAGKSITITLTDVDDEVTENMRLKQLSEYDELTGLQNLRAFFRNTETKIRSDESLQKAGGYAVVFFDILRFKLVNDMFGTAEGDRLLIFAAEAISETFGNECTSCRVASDRFLIFTTITDERLDRLVDTLIARISRYDLPIEIICNAGIYISEDEPVAVHAAMDRAVITQKMIKGNYTVKHARYTETLRRELLSEQEITGLMSSALAENQFVVYYQPQYNHSTGRIVGAEALVRWLHPERGLIPPGVFIPIFEKNGFITKLDFNVFEQVCVFVRRCLDNGIPIVPVSTNFSRYDIFQNGFVEKLEKIRNKYNIDPKLLRVEITESVLIGTSENVNEVVRKLHDCGYIVEMDDFGSGYSSLNVLKDINLDIIKLDMRFLAKESESNRGGTILSSVVRMAKWLALPVIAEGVEEVAQADFLKSIGCDYIQGYLYSKPVPQKDFEFILTTTSIGNTMSHMRLIETLDAGKFWDPQSQETLIFSNFVGGAAIFSYHQGKIEMLRVNQKYLDEIGMNISEKEYLNRDPFETLSDTDRNDYTNTLVRAIETGEEQECETCRRFTSDCCGTEELWIRSTIRLIGKTDDIYLFYAVIKNVTRERERMDAVLNAEKRFNMASEQANIYYWEYDIQTKIMHPCFRCMRDLGLPSVLKNYPESAIQMGIIPPESADMYREWHIQLAEGVESLEAVIPLTVGRVPFRVKYTAEFDENGRPFKAYGSATLIVDGK